MLSKHRPSLEDAFTSMLRTDYIPLRDTDKLIQLSKYYVDYFGYLGQVVGETDQLIVGRRGTGKTTLLYRALIECINSWNPQTSTLAKTRTLAVYIDLSKCQTLNSTPDDDFEHFEHVFASELCEAIAEELARNWPELTETTGLFSQVFNHSEASKRNETKIALKRLARILTSGLPRAIDPSGAVRVKNTTESSNELKADSSINLGQKNPGATVGLAGAARESSKKESEQTINVTFRLSIADLLRTLNDLRAAAEISHIVILIDELSAIGPNLQRRFSTLARKILGNHSGVYLKICGITDNYTLGSSIILQRDIFQLSLDLDAYVERSGSLNAAMDGLVELSRRLISERLSVYTQIDPGNIFEDTSSAWAELSRAAMGVPRTIGIALKQAFYRALNSGRSRITRTDIEYGIKYASRAYIDQFAGTCGVTIPEYHEEIWTSILGKAINERAKVDHPASHFLLLPKNDIKLKFLKMFFLVHLLTDGRTTKKDKSTRSLYVFDYGICLENNLKYGTDKNVLRQQRFAFDDELLKFDIYFEKTRDERYICNKCGTVYKRSELAVAGQTLTFCPKDKEDLKEYSQASDGTDYTEEEMKIVGAIRSAKKEDEIFARRIADDVGCYVQKVAKFGEKLERDEIISREMKDEAGKNIYFRKEPRESKGKSARLMKTKGK